MNNPAAAHRLLGEVDTPRPLRVAAGAVNLRGWCGFEGVPEAPPVRLSTEAACLPAKARYRRQDVPARLPAESGFTIEGRLPAGVHVARCEAQDAAGTWHTFKTLVLAVDPAPLAAALDRPIARGRTGDRVKAGGWALHPEKTLAAVSLRYGHREVACALGLPRPDVPALFPGLPDAANAGFETADFLVAGHGPVRIKARFTDGTADIIRTPVEFTIATDENHGPELNLAAARIELPLRSAPVVEPPTCPANRPLNLLFVLSGSFGSNSALHVAALANELAEAGHACAVAVPHDLLTLSHHRGPRFRGLLHNEAAQGVTFTNGRGPDLIHAWTTRENVRVLTESLRTRHGAKVVVHLEDNEQQILALELGRSPAELAGMPPADLDKLVRPDQSHPRRSRKFLSDADGCTVITDRLRDFAPARRPCHTLWPAADARFFQPRPQAPEFRALLNRRAGETVLFYHGNVHAANAAEVRELYAAVLRLNQAGQPVTLIRTGLDAVDFLGDLAAPVAPQVLPLGQILHHHHLPALMALADIFVQPGGSDAFNDYRFPSKLPEFFSIGRPVVLPRTNLGALVRHGIDAYVLDRADAAGIAEAVTELRRDRELYTRLSQGALAFAQEHFSWRRSAEALAKFYASLTG